MATSYSDVYKVFKNKIEDNRLAMLENEDQNEQLAEWLDSAVSMIYLDGLKIEHDLINRDNDFEEFEDDLSKAEIEVLSLYMVVAWYDQKINSLEHTLMYFGSKDEKWTSQRDHMNVMIKTQEMYKKKAKNYFLNYAAKNNKYLDGDS